MKHSLIALIAVLLVGCSPEDDDHEADTGMADMQPADVADDASKGDAGDEDMADAGGDADMTLPPAARGPCTTAADCMLSEECACPEPMLDGENPEACHTRYEPNTVLACRDTFGAEQVGDPLRLVCHQKQCNTFAGDFCEVYENSPNAGVGVLKEPFLRECATDVDCEIVTRLNPCGCEEAVSNSGSSGNPAAYWTEDVMETVWNTAETECGEQGDCDCPPAPSDVTCNQDEGRCELVP